MSTYTHNKPLALESGMILPNFELEYTVFGNPRGPVVWVFHALTGNANVNEWWPALFERDSAFSPDTHRIVCANVLGSCYGSTGPLSHNPKTGTKYFLDFPLITVADNIKAFRVLAEHLGIRHIDTAIGASFGGQQAIEWAVADPDFISNLVVIGTSAQASPWQIAWNASQRSALAADITFESRSIHAGRKGLAAARAAAMLSYRSYNTFNSTQRDSDLRESNFSADSYVRYQGHKLVQRFHAHSYYALTRTMDTHNVARHTGDIGSALKRVSAHTLCVYLQGDVLFPRQDQIVLEQNIPFAQSLTLTTEYGHDGFLVDQKLLNRELCTWKEAKHYAA